MPSALATQLTPQGLPGTTYGNTSGRPAGFVSIPFQALWEPVWLWEVDNPATVRFASRDLDDLADFYDGRLVDDPVATRRLADLFWGTVELQDVQLKLANADGSLTAFYLSDPAGRRMIGTRYDRLSHLRQVVYRGQIASVSLDVGAVEIEITNLDASVFETLLPRGAVTTARFPRAIDVGKSLTVVLGRVPKVSLLYINEDLINNQYDYLVGRGVCSVTRAYRNGINNSFYPIQPSEYTVSTTLYPGLTVMRFTVAQWDFQNQRHQLWADVIGLQPERNFARAIRTLLSDPVWGLNLPVDASSFDAAEADIAALGEFFCDGTLSTPRQAQEILRELLLVRGMRLGITADGAWTLTVDNPKLAGPIVLGDGTGDGPRNLLTIGPRRRPAVPDRIQSVICHYGLDTDGQTYLFSQSRSSGVAATDSVGASGTPSDGNTVTINGRSYTFKTALTPIPYEVLINGQDGSLTNLQHAINGSGGTPGTDYAAPAPNLDVTADAVASHAIVLRARVRGTLGNALALDVSGGVLSVGDAAFSGGTDGRLGRPKDFSFNFIWDHATADKVADYLYKRMIAGEETVPVSVEAALMTEGDLVTLSYAPLSYADELLEAREVGTANEKQTAILRGYDAAAFVYEPGMIGGLGVGGFEIIAVDTEACAFTVAGDHVIAYPVGSTATVANSTWYDGTYTVVSSALVGGNTVITVICPIPAPIPPGGTPPPPPGSWPPPSPPGPGVFIPNPISQILPGGGAPGVPTGLSVCLVQP